MTLLLADGLMSSSEATEVLTSSNTTNDEHSVTTIAFISLTCGSELGSTLYTEQEREIFISSNTPPAKEPGTHEAIILDDCCCRVHTLIGYLPYSLDISFDDFRALGQPSCALQSPH